MKDIPEGLEAEAFVAACRMILNEQYTQKDGYYCCRQCNGSLRAGTAYASVHATEFEDNHAGGGDVFKFSIPYCPMCEPEGAVMYTCVHVPLEQDFRDALRGLENQTLRLPASIH